MKFTKYLANLALMFCRESKIFKDLTPEYQTKLAKEARPCLLCQTKHNHNNSFCSVKCCKEYTQKEKEARELQRMQKKLDKIQKHRLTRCYAGRGE